MASVASTVVPAVPAAVASVTDSVGIDTRPQLGPNVATTGASKITSVPPHETEGETPGAPEYSGTGGQGQAPDTGEGAPSVPRKTTALFRAGPADPHYTSTYEAGDPYATVQGQNKTLGYWSKVTAYLNHVFNGTQNVNSAGWQQSSPQQRTSYMRLNGADGLNGAYWFSPKQLPQQANTQRLLPVLGTDAPGVTASGGVVLNSSTFGAGQTAGGIGGNQYSPVPGPPDTNSTATSASQGAEPMWG